MTMKYFSTRASLATYLQTLMEVCILFSQWPSHNTRSSGLFKSDCLFSVYSGLQVDSASGLRMERHRDRIALSQAGYPCQPSKAFELERAHKTRYFCDLA